jgi:hypothetical protein
MDKEKMEAAVARLIANASGVRYGTSVLALKVHEGRVVSISYETTECTKEREELEPTKPEPEQRRIYRGPLPGRAVLS